VSADLGPEPIELPDAGAALCAWCDKASVTEVIRTPGRSNRRTAPVCEKHAKEFEARGIDTVRSEVEKKLEADVKRSQKKNVRRW
jgi:hypothetical protein